ncbi:MAG: M48 family metallopeptidase [Eubacteriaceae bacterium]
MLSNLDNIPELLKKYHYNTGEKHKYLGDYYRLVVKESTEATVEIENYNLLLYVNDLKSHSHKELILDLWYREQAREIFVEALAKAIVTVAPYDITIPDLKIYRLDSRWGACSPKSQRVILNLELIKTPKECIEYIALHEMLHFRFPNHNLSFYGALGDLMKDWKEREDLLNRKYRLM